MNGYDPIDDALDAAIDALQRGRPLDAALYDQRPHGSALLPLLETAEAVRSAPPPPLPRELPHNFAMVRAAVERARMAQPDSEQIGETSPRHWWSRKLTFASLSVPVGAAALILTAGAAGATASVLTTDLGATVADVVLPAQLADGLPGKSGDAPGHNKAPGGPPSANPGSSGGEAPGSDNQPTALEVSGTISDVNGGNFTLTNGDGVWHVQTDVATEISGEILEGGTANVEGVVRAEKNLHATDVSASGGTPDAPPGPEGTTTPHPNAGSADGDGNDPPDDPGDGGLEAPPGSGASNSEEHGDGGGNQEP
jgi:hypothetical protein